jgi:WXG100 family type VII secretion target
MAQFSVTPESLTTAAGKIESESLNYENASKVAKSSADTLSSAWVGDAQKVFVSEQERAYGWYLQMAIIARDYAAFLRQAANDYVTTDGDSATTISSK